jgi:hypothetical protein
MKISNKTVGIILISPTVVLTLYVISVKCIDFAYHIGLSGFVYLLMNFLIGLILSISLIVGCGYLLKGDSK